ncbi:aminoimidazole riboside kinase [Bacillus idriensis]|uniref:Aminoimidazole riboside kinase n=1 Tax=Metabacillus idriensis TaxID=324768 RepID=A0A6I2MAW2_9BACI|nr:aminoimidazole riboside kinase [Metabacillus idriensis]MRX54106.1 aminoimidazole riboside kinase [Metabacillus idriensis]
MKKEIISLGEALIDFIPVDSDNMIYQKSPGGAPANVAVGLARLGADSAFLGKVGNDVLGTFLKDTLASYGVHTNHMMLSDEAKTGAVFITLAENGERSFDFYINPSADRFLKREELNESLFEDSKILHYGSISMISEPSRSATIRAVELARKNRMIVSYDPNLRLSLWENEEAARETILSMFESADLIKISEEELEFLTGEATIEKGVEKLSDYNIPLLLVTLGSEGSYAFTQNVTARIHAMQVNAVDTTGAGDAFVSGVLYKLNEYEGNLASLTEKELQDIGRFASVSGGLAASVKGAMTALPTLKEVQGILQNS